MTDFSDTSHCASSRPIGLTSSTSAGSIPARGLIMMLRTASPSGLSSRSPSLAITSCKRRQRCFADTTDLQIGPPRQVDVTVAEKLCGIGECSQLSGLNVADCGRIRTINPSPLCIGRKAPGHQPFTSNATERFKSYSSDVPRTPGCSREHPLLPGAGLCHRPLSAKSRLKAKSINCWRKPLKTGPKTPLRPWNAAPSHQVAVHDPSIGPPGVRPDPFDIVDHIPSLPDTRISSGMPT